jgi:hypothetical protein
VAEQKHVLLIDAAEKLAKNPRCFYDQIHFNDAGSQVLATLIADELTPVMKGRGSAAH